MSTSASLYQRSNGKGKVGNCISGKRSYRIYCKSIFDILMITVF